MCTAVTYLTNDFYFGRNLDYDFTYGESVTVMPRNYPLPVLCGDTVTNHYAAVGMAHVADGYPLYYDGVNEKGLCAAGLNFAGNAVYSKAQGRNDIAQFEFIPRLLATCADVCEAREKIADMNMTDTAFNDSLPPAQLHWLIADKNDCVVLEITKYGVNLYDNPTGVLTNNPPFPYQMAALNNYINLSPNGVKNRFSDKITLDEYSRGMGAIGMPGDLSSQSRFVRAAFVRLNSVSPSAESESVSQFFHILTSVEQQRGCCEVEHGKYEITVYSCCCNADRGIYYYTTYDNRSISAVDMHSENLDGSELVCYKLNCRQQFAYVNRKENCDEK